MSFLAELKRRNVFRVATVYAATAFVVLQVASITFAPLHLPPWAMTLVVVLVIVGFPIALVVAWAFELSPGFCPSAARCASIPCTTRCGTSRGSSGWSKRSLDPRPATYRYIAFTCSTS